jgi:hypothetical protein
MLNNQEKLLAYYLLGKTLLDAMDNKQQFTIGEILGAGMMNQRPVPTKPELDPEYIAGEQVAKNGGKMKTNPYEGGSRQWWSWHAGYKAAKEQDARRQRRQQLKA